MFSGAYFIGRDANKCKPISSIAFSVAAADNKPYDSFDGIVFKKITLNTDVTKDIPIAGTLVDLKNNFLTSTGIAMNTMFDFLAVSGAVDHVFTKDAIDYEEVNLSSFDLYQKLGSGFATTAMIEKISDGVYRVKETPATDTNRIAAINDGIYSTLENLGTDYRVLTCGVADAVITGSIPRKADFQVTAASPITIGTTGVGSDAVILASAKVDSADKTNAKKYKFTVSSAVPAGFNSPSTITSSLYTTAVIDEITSIATADAVKGMTFENGTMFATVATGKATLYRYTNGVLAAEDDAVANADLVNKLVVIDGTISRAQSLQIRLCSQLLLLQIL
jgi:hypothetical protein